MLSFAMIKGIYKQLLLSHKMDGITAISVTHTLVTNFKNYLTKNKMNRLIIIVSLSCLFISCKSQVNYDNILVEQVKFSSKGVTLSGSICLPQGDGVFPAVVMVHGSGPLKRELAYAKLLARNNIICLTYDKRGVGNSGGNYEHENNTSVGNLNILAADAAEAVKLLRSYSQVDTSNIGLLGMSQAGWIIPIAASSSPDVDFVVILSGPVVTTNEEHEFSQITNKNSNFFEKHTDIEINNIVMGLGKAGFDPAPYIESIDVKGLWVFGGKDLSIPVASSINNLNTIKTVYRKQFDIKVFQDANHNLKLPGISDYPSPVINKYLIEWIKRLSIDRMLYFSENRPGLESEKFAPGLVSTENVFEFGSVFSTLGNQFYYATEIDGKAEIRQMQLSGNKWTNPITIQKHDKFSYNDPFLSPDENRLYFISNQPKNKDDQVNDYDIWYIKKDGNQKWSLPVNEEAINSEKNEYYISFTSSGRIYFSSNRQSNNYDIYFSEHINEKYQPPVKLSDSINTEFYEGDVFVSPQEDFVIFCSERPSGYGKGDLYISFKKGAHWSQAKNLGNNINTCGHELCPYVSFDDKYLFFTRDGDIYWVEFEKLLHDK